MVPDCMRSSDSLPFASYTFNVGKHSICRAHKDGCNLSTGLCLVCPFGNFDHTKGGHLILHELKLVLEVPSGSVVLFPSALITHQNIPIRENESRRAITAFTPGTIFSWVENKYRPTGIWESNQMKDEVGKRIWKTGKSRFPHILEMF